jgi:hypothetical protein
MTRMHYVPEVTADVPTRDDTDSAHGEDLLRKRLRAIRACVPIATRYAPRAPPAGSVRIRRHVSCMVSRMSACVRDGAVAQGGAGGSS